tara:strand:+ start:188 stop:442 length:255 start_codon:yes stop_codon:yes gene_type:complete
MLKKSEEKVAKVIVGIKTNNAKVSMNLVEIFEPTTPLFLSDQVRKIFLITLKQRENNKITSIDNVLIAIVGVVLKKGKEFEKTK